MAAATHWVVTAKFTDDGTNAWRRADGTWGRALGEAGLVADEETARAHAKASAATEQRVVSDPYVIEVDASSGAIEALSARERIRATGPTVRIRRPDTGVRR